MDHKITDNRCEQNPSNIKEKITATQIARYSLLEILFWLSSIYFVSMLRQFYSLKKIRRIRLRNMLCAMEVKKNAKPLGCRKLWAFSYQCKLLRCLPHTLILKEKISKQHIDKNNFKTIKRIILYVIKNKYFLH